MGCCWARLMIVKWCSDGKTEAKVWFLGEIGVVGGA